MVFKKLAMDYAQFDLVSQQFHLSLINQENLDDLKAMLDENCMKHDGPMSDLDPSSASRAELMPSLNEENKRNHGKNNKRREQHYIVRDLVTCLSLCHNVTPTFPDPLDSTIRDFQASSPDEVALVKFADSLGMKLMDRDQQKIVIQNSSGTLEVNQFIIYAFRNIKFSQISLSVLTQKEWVLCLGMYSPRG